MWKYPPLCLGSHQRRSNISEFTTDNSLFRRRCLVEFFHISYVISIFRMIEKWTTITHQESKFLHSWKGLKGRTAITVQRRKFLHIRKGLKGRTTTTVQPSKVLHIRNGLKSCTTTTVQLSKILIFIIRFGTNNTYFDIIMLISFLISIFMLSTIHSFVFLPIFQFFLKD